MDRAILDWAEKSSFGHAGKAAAKSSMDKPEMIHGILSDSVHLMLRAVAQVQRRNFLIMELRGNLMKEGRKKTLDLFPSNMFKKVACTLIGEPTVDFKKYSQQLMLKAKQ